MVTRACPHTPIVRQGRHPRPSQGWPWGAPGCTLTHRSPGPAGRPLLPCELLAGSHQPRPGPEHLQIAGRGGTSRSHRADTMFHSPVPAGAQDEGENPGLEKTSRRAGCAHGRWGSAPDSRVQHGTTRNTQGTHQPVRSPARAHMAWHGAGPVNMQATGPCPHRGGLRRRRAGCSLSAGG